jgi:hypothetical protein
VSQLAPGITTATGTLAKTYRKAGAKMPSTSKAQHNLMEGIAHGWKPSGMKKAPPKSVAKDFVEADKEVGAFRSSVKKRNAKIKAKRGRQ